MMRFWLAVGFIVLSASFAAGESQPERQQVRRLVKELKALQKTGVAIHKKYDFSKSSDSKACAANNQVYREKSLKLKKQFWEDIHNGKAPVPDLYRADIGEALDNAAMCVQCGDIKNECAQLSSSISRIEVRLQKKKADIDGPVNPKDVW